MTELVMLLGTSDLLQGIPLGAEDEDKVFHTPKGQRCSFLGKKKISAFLILILAFAVSLGKQLV